MPQEKNQSLTLIKVAQNATAAWSTRMQHTSIENRA